MSGTGVAILIMVCVGVLVAVVATIRETLRDGYGRRPSDRDYDSRRPEP